MTKTRRKLRSWPAPNQSPEHFTKSGELTRQPPAQEKPMAVIVQTEPARKTKGPVRREIPGNRGREVMRGVMQSGTLRVAQTSVHFHASNEILQTEITAVG